MSASKLPVAPRASGMSDAPPPSDTSVVRQAKVKNKAPAPVQITAEQILKEAWENREDSAQELSLAPKQHLVDIHELQQYRRERRQAWESRIGRQSSNVSVWIRYAKWEELQLETERARSIYERALDENSSSEKVWAAYAEMEMKLRFINHARNILDRAVTVLPRSTMLWNKYVYMEEVLGEEEKARQVFVRWMKWRPAEPAWISFVRFELRHGKDGNARRVFEEYIRACPSMKAFLKYADFEEKHGTLDRAREIYERILQELAAEMIHDDFYICFARFETRAGEFERARAIYQNALRLYAESQANKELLTKLLDSYSLFEKQHGDRDSAEELLASRKRHEYEELLSKTPCDYDKWMDLIRLETDRLTEWKRLHAGVTGYETDLVSNGLANRINSELSKQYDQTVDSIRSCYERAVSNTPSSAIKQDWKRYIYLWINHAVWEELDMKDLDRAAQVYRSVLKIIPHKRFTFTKLWIQAAQLEIRRLDLAQARRMLGQAIGHCPQKPKVYRIYIRMETELGEEDRVRKIYRKWIENMPYYSPAWIEFAQMEASLQEEERSKSIFEIAISEPNMDMPEFCWKAYIDYEWENGNLQAARNLYERLVAKSAPYNVNAYISWASFETEAGDPSNPLELSERVRNVYRSADTSLKETILGMNAQMKVFTVAQGTASNKLLTMPTSLGSVLEIHGAEDNVADKSAPRATSDKEEVVLSLKKDRARLLEAWERFERSELGDEDILRTELEPILPKLMSRKRPILNRDGNVVRYEEYQDYEFEILPAEQSAIKLLDIAQMWKRARHHDS